MIHLDANASVPPVAEALVALVEAARDHGGHNPSSPHRLGRTARSVLDDAREACAHMLGARFAEVFFTSGATEGNRLVVDLLREASRDRPLRVVTTPLEHPSSAKPLRRAHERGEIIVDVVPVERARVVFDSASLAQADAIVVTAAHNETGIVVDIEQVCAAAPATAIIAVDAAQATARSPPLPSRVDVVVCSAHKLGGVVGAGAVVLRGRARSLSLPYTAGGQEQGVRPGTEPLPTIAAMGAAAKVIERTREQHRALRGLRDALETRVAAVGCRVLGADVVRLDNTSAFLVPDVDPDALRLAIDQAGIAVGFGAACSALSPEPSPSLMALGLSHDDARRVVRVSLPPGVSEATVISAADTLAQVFSRLR